MAKSEKVSKSGFVIKLSCETVQKLSEEHKCNNIESTINEQNKEETNALEQPKIEHVLSIQSKESLEVSIDEKSKYESLSSDVKNTINKTDSNKVSKDSSWGDYAPYITYEGEDAIYTDPTSQQKFVWNQATNSWDVKESADVPGRVYSYEDDAHTYTEADGSKFFWDAEKKAWLPKVDDDFLAHYQMSYGFVDNTTKKEEEKAKDTEKKKEEGNFGAGMKRKSEPQWFDQSDDKNTKVYVSNLPLDITEEEFVDLMQKFGLVERDVSTQKMKVKLYMDKQQNCFKGDALCTYIKIESVDLALKLLDGSDYKGKKIKVERAQFQLKGEYNPALKPKKKKKKELEKIKKMQQKLFDWRPEKFLGERSKHERIVIVKNLFHPTDFDKEVQLILDYQQDLREECSKCGEVRKVVIYDRHPEGVAQITMKEPEHADAVIALINGRWFGKRQITAEIWDGRTKYRIAETDADINKRIDKWGRFLEGEEGKEDKVETSSSTADKKDSSSEVDTKKDQNVATVQNKQTTEDLTESISIDKQLLSDKNQ